MTKTCFWSSEAKLRWGFTRRYLARQPNLPFKRTKKLLGVIPTPVRKKRIAQLTAGPMKGIVAGTRSSSGNKRKRNSNPPSKWQPGICDRPRLWWHVQWSAAISKLQLASAPKPLFGVCFYLGMWVSAVVCSCGMQQSAAPYSWRLLAIS